LADVGIRVVPTPFQAPKCNAYICPVDQGGMPESGRRPWGSPLAPNAHSVRSPLPPGTESPGYSRSAHCPGTSRSTGGTQAGPVPRAFGRAPPLTEPRDDRIFG
jgi:hypothetical protein